MGCAPAGDNMNKSLLTGIALLTLASAGAHASNFDRFDRAAQVAASEVILTGRVAGTSSRWAHDNSAIITEADVEVTEVWKGAPADVVQLQTLGGTVGTVMLRVDGAAEFAVGERVVLFLDEENGSYRPYGMMFGKYEIVGSAPAEFVLGKLPPAVPGADRYETISASLEEIRLEIQTLVAKETR